MYGGARTRGAFPFYGAYFHHFWLVVMGESGKGIESPIEILWQLIEESGKWTEESVMFARQLLILFVVILYLCVLSFWIVFYGPVAAYISGEGNLPLPAILILGVWVASFIFMILVALKMRRRYKNRVARRDRWREKFEILKRKEEEIEKLLSEEAG